VTRAERTRLAERIVQMLANNPAAKALLRQTLDMSGYSTASLRGLVLDDEAELLEEQNEVAGLHMVITQPGQPDVIFDLIIQDATP
jgi:hypothetical protein